MTTPLIETIARAIYAQSYRNCCHGESPEVGDESWQSYLSEAAAAITALTEAGYRILPVEPDVDLLMSTAEHYDFAGWPSAYRAMIEAATPDHIIPAIQTVGPLDSEKGE